MQGGITSGVVYPALVCKLAEEYDFQSIGGTSAGAIAAAITAAAQYARNRQKPDAFAPVAKVPAWLGAASEHGSGSNLFSLFQPQPATAGLYKFATAFLLQDKLRRAVALVAPFWLEILLGCVPGILLCSLARAGSGWHHLGIILLGLWVCFDGALVCAACGLLLRLRILPSYHFGFCTGYAAPAKNKPPTLIAWLDDQIDSTAGMPADKPLTFGDLEDAHVTLRMMTTCLTWGRPFTMPFTTGAFYFDPEELKAFFPRHVVKWMVDHPWTKPGDPEWVNPNVDTHLAHGKKLYLLPAAKDLPVIFAARLSLSFPFLFCAVPLYAVDYTRRVRKPNEPVPPKPVPGGSIGPGEKRVPERVWFSDGGLCNNFPINLFDSPLPLWPTFGVELTELRPDRPPIVPPNTETPSDRVWIPNSNGGGINPGWTRVSPVAGLGSTGALAGSMIDSARNWVNSLQAEVPGYRDRIVHIALDKEEGGLNLNMPQARVAALSSYGTAAAQALIDHFIHGTDHGQPTPMTWNNQRFIRYRSTMTLLQKFLVRFAFAIKNPEKGDTPYDDLIQRGPHDPPPTGYRLDPSQVPDATAQTAALVALGSDMTPPKGMPTSLEPGSPHPEPILVIRPDF